MWISMYIVLTRLLPLQELGASTYQLDSSRFLERACVLWSFPGVHRCYTAFRIGNMLAII